MPMIEHPTEWPGAAKAALTRKVGPLPVWGWAAVAVGGVAAYYLISKRSGSTTAATTNPVATAVAGGFAGNYGSGGGDTGTNPPSPGGVSGNPGGTADGGSPGGVATLPTQGSSTPAANDAFISSALASGAMVPAANGIGYTQGATPYTGSQMQQLLTLIGPIQPHGTPNGAAIPSTTSTPAGAFTGVQGLSTATGDKFLYQVFQNGKLVGSQVGPANADTTAIASKFGVQI